MSGLFLRRDLAEFCGDFRNVDFDHHGAGFDRVAFLDEHFLDAARNFGRHFNGAGVDLSLKRRRSRGGRFPQTDADKGKKSCADQGNGDCFNGDVFGFGHSGHINIQKCLSDA